MSETTRQDLLNALNEHRKSKWNIPDFRGISPGELHMLQLIGKILEQAGSPENEIQVSKICERSRMSKPGVSHFLNALEKRGLIKRAAGQHDRRAVYVQMTEEGQRTTADFISFMDFYMTKIIGRFGEQNTCELIRLLCRLNELTLSIDHPALMREWEAAQTQIIDQQ